MANPFDFSAGAVLTAAQLNQIGDFETFTPSWTNITVGNAANTGVYAQVNELVFWQVEFIAGSSTSYSSSAFAFDMPVASVSDLTYIPMGTGWLRPDAGTIWTCQNIGIQSNQTIIPYVYVQAGSNGYTNVTSAKSSIPNTWNTSGQIFMQGFYKVA
tara:strand:- start:264 stop:734 length:471 start_codon:yes stop_codon:yes gene_type:complete